jgi:ATP-dependent Clp protease ATP-binding subunit ClpC
MTFSNPESMQEITARATQLADSGKGRLDTGYLLLAVFTGTGTAAKTLSLRGLTETSLRAAIREIDPEPTGALAEVEAKARQYAATIREDASPTGLHVLAALATVRGCAAYAILARAGLNIDTIRNQALRNMTSGLTRERGEKDDVPGATKRVTPGGRPDALPLPKQLKIRAVDGRAPVRERRAKKREAPPANEPARPRRPVREVPPAPIPRDMGTHIEQIQRRTRDLRVHRPPAEEPKRAERAPARAPAAARAAEVRVALDPKEFPLLSGLGRNLTAAAAEGRLDEIVGREHELARIADVLNKRRANCPCLVGPSGVGKTAIVEGLALELARGRAPGLEDRVIIEVRPSDLLTGTSLRGALGERLEGIKAEVARASGRIVLFLDELHALLASHDGAEAVEDLKAAIGRGELPCIAATTDEEYARHVGSDPALARRFTAIEIAEPREEEAVRIIAGVAPAYAAHHKVSYGGEAIEAAVRMSARYLPERALPDKAIGLLDLAGARAKRSGAGEVTAADVATVLAEQIGVPAERLVSSDRQKLLDLERELEARIIGHQPVLAAIAETLRRNAAGFRTGRPIGSFLLLGPTGVGKTETAKALAEILFANESAMVRLDMTEFSEPHAIARLVGAPPGYIGHEEGGQLTEAVRRRPYCLVLLDEIEKAHRDVVQILLQVLDDGRLTDGRGRTVDFGNAVIAMTSNLGADLREIGGPKRRMGFAATDGRDARPARGVREAILEAARAALPPELWNRIDEPLVFEPLTREQVAAIARLMLSRVAAQLEKEHGVSLELDDRAVEALADAGGFDAELGARPMRRTIQRLVEGPIARLVLSGELVRGGAVALVAENGGLVVRPA